MLKSVISSRRWVHLFSAIAVAFVGFVTVIVWPDLWSGAPTAFATLAGYVTVYGLVFAIVELVRTRKAAEEAKAAAEEASNAVLALYDMRDGAECLSLIEAALTGIDREGSVQMSMLARIVKLYTATYCEEQKDDQSPQRLHVSMVESYASLSKPSAAPVGKLKGALISMTAQLSATAGGKVAGGVKQ